MQNTYPLWTNDHRDWYRKVYLTSDHWKDLRAEKLRANPSCEHCGNRAGDVHHVNYRQLFDVEISDLLSLCRPCHNAEHEKNGMPRREKHLEGGRAEIEAAIHARFLKIQKSNRAKFAARANQREQNRIGNKARDAARNLLSKRIPKVERATPDEIEEFLADHRRGEVALT